jgi:hypothetical protein
LLRVAQRSQRANGIVERRASNDERFERREAAEDVRLVVCQVDLGLVFAGGAGAVCVEDELGRVGAVDIPGPGLKIWYCDCRR